MNKVSILLVDNPDADTEKIDSALRESGINYTCYFAGSGKKGLNILMGDPYHDLIAPEAVKIKPTLVIVSKELKDIPAREFLGIIGKYYSLRDKKFVLLSDSLSKEERFDYDRLGVMAYLQRPLDKEQVTKQVKPLLNVRQIHFSFIPIAIRRKHSLASFIKGKLISMGVGVKIAAACLILTLIVSAISIRTTSDRVPGNGMHDDLAARAADMPEQATVPEPATEAKLPVPQKQLTKKKESASAPAYKDRSKTPTHTISALPKPKALRIIAVKEQDGKAN